MVARGRGSGSQRVTPELVCHLPILTSFGCSGGSGDHTRPPGSRQGTIACVRTLMDVEQQSDHKQMTPSGIELLVCGAGSHPLVSTVCKRRGANGSEPVRRFTSLGTATTSPCSAHRIRLSL